MTIHLFSTASYRYFANAILDSYPRYRDSFPVATLIERKQFSNGEQYYRLGVPNRRELMDSNAIIVGGTHTDDDFLEIIRIGHTLADAGTRRRIFVIPFFGYSTMDRAVKPGEVVTAKVNARLLSSIPNTNAGNVFLFLDLHNQSIIHYFEGENVRQELYAEPTLIEGIKSLDLNNFVFGSADMGRPLWVQSFARHFNTDIVYIQKSRDFEATKVDAVIGDVAGKNVVIYDDMCRSGDTLVHAANAYLARGATAIYAVISHLSLSNIGVAKKLIDSPIVKIITANSHPMSQRPEVGDSKKFIVKDVSGLFSSAISQVIN